MDPKDYRDVWGGPTPGGFKLKAEPADAPAWQTVCEGCRQWVGGIYHVTQEGKRLCYECTPPAMRGMPKKVAAHIGPPPTPGVPCACGRDAAARCHGCGVNFCEPCWNRHSHTNPGAWDRLDRRDGSDVARS